MTSKFTGSMLAIGLQLACKECARKASRAPFQLAFYIVHSY